MKPCLIGQATGKCVDICQRIQHFGVECNHNMIASYSSENFENIRKNKSLDSKKKGPSKRSVHRNKILEKQKLKEELLKLHAPREGTKNYKTWIRCEKFCYLCLHPIELEDTSIDHVIPLSRGGKKTKENEKAAHRECNGWKADKLLIELDLVGYRKSKSYYTSY